MISVPRGVPEHGSSRLGLEPGAFKSVLETPRTDFGVCLCSLALPFGIAQPCDSVGTYAALRRDAGFCTLPPRLGIVQPCAVMDGYAALRRDVFFGDK